MEGKPSKHRLYRNQLKLKAVAYKGGSCESCGYDKSPKALEFHHLNASTKDFTISETGRSKSWERVRAELDKCIMLCANCHREAH